MNYVFPPWELRKGRRPRGRGGSQPRQGGQTGPHTEKKGASWRRKPGQERISGRHSKKASFLLTPQHAGSYGLFLHNRRKLSEVFIPILLSRKEKNFWVAKKQCHVNNEKRKTQWPSFFIPTGCLVQRWRLLFYVSGLFYPKTGGGL